MSTPAAPSEEGFDVAWSRRRNRAHRGAAPAAPLARVIDAEELDAFEVALDNSKAERISAAERRWA